MVEKSTARKTVIGLRTEGQLGRLTMDGEPFVEILAFWQLYREAQVPGALEKVNLPRTRSCNGNSRVSLQHIFLSWYCLVPSGTSLRGLKVRVLPLQFLNASGSW